MCEVKLGLKEIQSRELEILLYLDKICRENNIKYYLFGGTLLGAVKYKGFIPWDDDIDVALLRDDYMKLMKILDKKEDRFKLLSIYNTADYYYAHAKLVDSETKLIENAKPIKELGINIDIFPIDGYPSSYVEYEMPFIRILKNLVFRRYKIQDSINNEFSFLKIDREVKNRSLKDLIYGLANFIMLPFGYNFFVNLFDKIMQKSSKGEAEYVGVRCFDFNKKEIFKKSDLVNSDEFTFENHKFMGFENYDLYLRKQYGDYKSEPPIEQRKTHHQFDAFHKCVK